MVIRSHGDLLSKCYRNSVTTLSQESSSSGWDESDVELPENKHEQPSPKTALYETAPVAVGKPEVNKEDSDAWDSDEEADSEAENNKEESPIKLINENTPINESKLNEVSFTLCKDACAFHRCRRM